MKTLTGLMLMSLSIMPKIILGILMVLVMLTMMACADEVTEEGTAVPESAEEQYELGLMYYNGGFGVPKDFDEAVEVYRKAVEQGIAKAQDNLGELYTYGRAALEDLAKNIMYEVGLCLGPDEDYDEALKWFRKAAAQGHVEAQYWVGYMYCYGIGMPEDYAEALKWFRKAAEQGHAQAQNSIGDMYFFGNDVPKNNAEALKWFRRAAEQGHVEALNSLGYIYYYGDGVPEDKDEARKWYLKAADQGNAMAQYTLGEMYYKGDGVPQDYAEAVKWFRKAAEQGSYYAQHDLGMMWFAGDEGVPDDDDEAAKWYSEVE